MNILSLFQEIDTFLFDVDGVFTDNKILVTESGEFLRSLDVRDGFAVRTAISMGYTVGIITAGRSEGVKIRFEFLGVEHYYQGSHDKSIGFQDFIEVTGTDPKSILYMGDDIADIYPLKMVGLPCCPSDAISEVKEICKYISPLKGGDGCAREVIEKVMKLQGTWPVKSNFAL
jgi:3-deoxy-D-manno-octulosonate 8-phosphate phosphatase (KDO 8-P phosphatase)